MRLCRWAADLVTCGDGRARAWQWQKRLENKRVNRLKFSLFVITVVLIMILMIVVIVIVILLMMMIITTTNPSPLLPGNHATDILFEFSSFSFITRSSLTSAIPLSALAAAAAKCINCFCILTSPGLMVANRRLSAFFLPV
jgi:hypothetical protein